MLLRSGEPSILTCNEAVRLKKIFNFQNRVLKNDWHHGKFSTHAIPLFNDGNEIIEWVGVHADITDQEAAKEEMQ